MARLTCRSCASTIPASGIRFKQRVAICNECDAENPLDSSGNPDLSAQPTNRIVPAGLTARRVGRELELTHRLPMMERLWLAVFCVVAAAIVGMGVLKSVGDGAVGAVMLSGIAAVDLLVLFYIFGNTTAVRLSEKELRVSHAPIPVPGAISVSRDLIRQVYVRRYSGYRADKTGDENRVLDFLTDELRDEDYSYSIHLMARRDRGDRQRSLRILKGLRNLEQARFIEVELERFLGIEDRRVSTEVK